MHEKVNLAGTCLPDNCPYEQDRGVGGREAQSEVWVPKADPDGSGAAEVATCQISEQFELAGTRR